MKSILPLAFLLSSLCLCGESFALDAETKTPYHLHIVLHFADQRLLTPVFRDRVSRELRDGLRASFGDLATVEMADAHPQLADVLQNGLKALDGWRGRSADKTHFVLIDYSGGRYEIQARQLDGLTGQPGRVVRRDRTEDREFVAKAAALLVEQDFGLVGSFDAWPGKGAGNEDQPVTVSLRGAGLGVPLDRWVVKGDLFAAVQMPAGDAGPGRPVADALLVVDSPPVGTDTTCVCRVFRRYAPPRDAGGGYRCVRLGAVQAPLRLRLLQALPDGANEPLKDTVTVQVRRHGFDKEDADKIQKSTDGPVDTVGAPPFDRVAFVSVLSGGQNLQANVPVPLLDDQPVTLAVNLSGEATTAQALRRADWERDVTAAWLAQNELLRETADLAGKPEKRKEAMEKIQQGVERGLADYRRLNEERLELEKAAPIGPGAGERLDKLNEGATELRAFLDKMKKIDAESDDPQKREWLKAAELGQQYEKDLEIDKALEQYDRILKEGYANEKLKAHADELRARWTPKGEEHRKARAFIYQAWPTLNDAELKDNLGAAKAAVEACKQAGDAIALAKFLKATDKHAVDMKRELDELHPDTRPDDEKQAKLIKELTDALAPLVRDVDVYLKTAAPAGK